MGMAAKPSGAWILNSLGEHGNPFGCRVKEEREMTSSGSWMRLLRVKHFLLNSVLSAFLAACVA